MTASDEIESKNIADLAVEFVVRSTNEAAFERVLIEAEDIRGRSPEGNKENKMARELLGLEPLPPRNPVPPEEQADSNKDGRRYDAAVALLLKAIKIVKRKRGLDEDTRESMVNQVMRAIQREKGDPVSPEFSPHNMSPDFNPKEVVAQIKRTVNMATKDFVKNENVLEKYVPRKKAAGIIDTLQTLYHGEGRSWDGELVDRQSGQLLIRLPISAEAFLASQKPSPQRGERDL